MHKRQQRGIIDSVTVRRSRDDYTQSKLQQRVKSIVVRLKGNRGRQINRLALIRFAVEVGIAEVFVRSASANPCTIRRPTLLTEDKVF